MNNRIWFKGIRTYSNEWVEGTPLFVQKKYYIANEVCQVPVSPETICQYIGYNDCVGRKAFEHDIVFYKNKGIEHKGEIIYRDGKYEVEWFQGRGFRPDIDFWFKSREIKIIGNRFDSKSE